MVSMATATSAVFLKLQPVRRILLVFRRNVITFFAFRALQNDVVSRHKTPNVLGSRFPRDSKLFNNL